MIVYLCGPIDQCLEHDWRDEARKVLRERGHICFDPYAAFQGHPESYDYARVSTINRQALCLCDVVLARIDFSVPMVGTWREIELARRHTPPIHVVTFGEDSLREHVESHDLIITLNLKGALNFIGKLAYRTG
jgi:hypothetical protein